MTLHIVILAAGQGKRMQSALPKVLHLLAGKPLLEHVIQTAQTLQPDTLSVIYGETGDKLRERFSEYPIEWIEQPQPLGTGHAVMQLLPTLAADARVLVLSGDVPLISLETLQSLIQTTPPDALGLLVANVPIPFGMGRLLRDEHQHIVGIVEEKDATDIQRQLNEVYAGILLAPAACLQQYLPKLQNHNAQREYYLTELIACVARAGLPITAVSTSRLQEIQGINDRIQLAALERSYQYAQACRWMSAGVTFQDPHRFDVRGTLDIGQDVEIDIDVICEGDVVIGQGSRIGSHVVLKNVHIGQGVHIKSHSVIEGAEIADGCQIGPFARIRPTTYLAENTQVGNFVEIKNSRLGAYSKACHLTYLGDTQMGAHVNIGAGTITCNYNGVKKSNTTIEDGAFVGSGVQLIAPVRVGAHAVIGAGSTITENAPAHALTLARVRQTTLSDWVHPEKRPTDPLPIGEQE